MHKSKIILLILVMPLVFSAGCAKNETNKTNEDFLCQGCNIILISIDTLRADHLGAYGYYRNTSPNIDEFAKQSIVFKNVYSQSPITAPSHMTMFTSLYPSVHGINNMMAVDDKIALAQRLSDSIITLPQILKEYNYSTAAFTGGGEVSGRLGFDKGFDIYMENDLIRRPAFTDAVLKYNSIPEEYRDIYNISEMLKWVEEKQKDKFFLFVHTYTAHSPYISPYPGKFSPNYTGDDRWKDYFQGHYGIYPQSYANSSKKINKVLRNFFGSVDKSDQREVENFIALYDSSVFYMDETIKLLFDKIEKLNLSGSTLIIFTSDHGEEFLEHGNFNHGGLYSEHIHVPLIIRLPKKINKTISEKARLIDLTPTMLDMLNISYVPKNYEFQGASLMPLLKNRHLDLDIYSEVYRSVGNKSGYSLISNDGWKYIFLDNIDIWEDNKHNKLVRGLFNLLEDPKEKKNLILEHNKKFILIEKRIKIMQEENNRLNEKLNQELKYAEAGKETAEADKETIEKLKSLGYVG